MLAVAVGLVKGLGEAVGHQKGEIGVLAAQLGVGVGVAVDGVDALHVLRHHVAVGIHAEGAHLIPVPFGAVDKLGLVDYVSDVLKDLGGQLHPYADIHLVVDEVDAKALALLGEPFGAGAAGGGDEPAAGELLTLAQGQAEILALPGDVGDGGVEPELQLVLQPLIDVLEDAQIVLCAQVLAPGLEQMQVIGQRPALQGPGLGGGGGEALGGGAVGHVDGVHIVDQLHHLPGVHEVGEPAAELGGEVELSVREGPGPAEAAHGVAHRAVDALLHLARHDGAAAAVDVAPLLQDHHLQLRISAH